MKSQCQLRDKSQPKRERSQMRRDDFQKEHFGEKAVKAWANFLFVVYAWVCLLNPLVPVCLETSKLPNHKFQEDGCNTEASM